MRNHLIDLAALLCILAVGFAALSIAPQADAKIIEMKGR